MGTRDKRVDAYIAEAQPFARPILEQLRATVHTASPDVDEAIKWGMPFFTSGGRLLANMAAFTAHAAFGFFRADDVMGAGKAERDAMGSFGRITSVRDLPPRSAIIAWVRRAVKLAAEGPRPAAQRRAAKPTPKVPAALAAAIKTDATLRAQWAAFTPGKRREYLAWIAEAKQPATRARRVATTIAQVKQGKSQNWRYETKRG
ncbi:MAG: YdeI/OmpD-associated family protein [Gemmatimonadetes bacterium]|nr:YdeI/OmpD-associated family protein [Gemmatimonadota bacterium]